MTISIPDDLMKSIDAKARSQGFETADAFVVQLLKRELAKEDEDDDEDYGAPPEVTVKTKAELEAKLLEALAGGPSTPMTQADWAEIRREARKRIDRGGQQ